MFSTFNMVMIERLHFMVMLMGNVVTKLIGHYYGT